MKNDKNTISADYTFPRQGTYSLTLKTTVDNVDMVFNYVQRISRGINTGELDRPRYPWAEMGLLAVGCGVTILTIVIFNNRHEIKKYSR